MLWTVKVYFVVSVIKSMSVNVLLGTVEWGALFAIVGSLASVVGQDRQKPHEMLTRTSLTGVSAMTTRTVDGT